MNVSCWEHFQRLFDRGNLKKTTEWRSGSVPWHDVVGKDGMKDVISPGQVEEQTSKTGSKNAEKELLRSQEFNHLFKYLNRNLSSLICFSHFLFNSG